ncbi:MAG: MFS transporter [bacterium]|nr:MFS transporter [bacterium]
MERADSIITDEKTQNRLSLLLGTIIFFSVLNGTMFNVAVPHIALEFQLLPSQVSWVITGYMVIFALGSLTYGKLADMYPVRNLVSLGLLLFNTGSVAGCFAATYPMALGARYLQACGAASIPALAMLTATRYFPYPMRGKAFGAISSAVALGAGAGPIVGGFITHALDWRYLFPVTLATLFTIPSFRRLLPTEPKRANRFDLLGLSLLATATILILLFVTENLRWGFLGGAVLLTAFVLHIRRSNSPFVKPGLFFNHPYRNTVTTAFLAMGTVFGMLFMVPLMLQDLNGADASQIGLVLFPGALTATLLGTAGGKLADRKGTIPVVYLGAGLLIAGLSALFFLAGATKGVIALVLVVAYTGFTFLQSSLSNTVSATLPREEVGIGMGIYNLHIFLSGAFSTALVGKLLDFQDKAPRLNPLPRHSDAFIYSDIYLLLMAVVLSALFLFSLTVEKRHRGGAARRQT